ncbi:unnamed protein product [Polarella glacialis]|uniref:Uncharacterized protein n=1 Tax=Polarella glacialis TaxID=89957 RepID=A0A813FUB7_POLGL|nr:unnamed protein product [Polarella glacialis]
MILRPARPSACSPLRACRALALLASLLSGPLLFIPMGSVSPASERHATAGRSGLAVRSPSRAELHATGISAFAGLLSASGASRSAALASDAGATVEEQPQMALLLAFPFLALPLLVFLIETGPLAGLRKK